jgi:hypothetical protein
VVCARRADVECVAQDVCRAQGRQLLTLTVRKQEPRMMGRKKQTCSESAVICPDMAARCASNASSCSCTSLYSNQYLPDVCD